MDNSGINLSLALQTFGWVKLFLVLIWIDKNKDTSWDVDMSKRVQKSLLFLLSNGSNGILLRNIPKRILIWSSGSPSQEVFCLKTAQIMVVFFCCCCLREVFKVKSCVIFYSNVRYLEVWCKCFKSPLSPSYFILETLYRIGRFLFIVTAEEVLGLSLVLPPFVNWSHVNFIPY